MASESAGFPSRETDSQVQTLFLLSCQFQNLPALRFLRFIVLVRSAIAADRHVADLQFSSHRDRCHQRRGSARAGITAEQGEKKKKIRITNSARDLREVSAYPGEDERMILAGSRFIVIKEAHRSNDGIMEIHLQEAQFKQV